MAFTRAMKARWNLGNTFDAGDCDWLSDPMGYETVWCGTQTKPEVFTLVKDTGLQPGHSHALAQPCKRCRLHAGLAVACPCTGGGRMCVEQELYVALRRIVLKTG